MTVLDWLDSTEGGSRFLWVEAHDEKPEWTRQFVLETINHVLDPILDPNCAVLMNFCGDYSSSTQNYSIENLMCSLTCQIKDQSQPEFRKERYPDFRSGLVRCGFQSLKDLLKATLMSENPDWDRNKWDGRIEPKGIRPRRWFYIIIDNIDGIYHECSESDHQGRSKFDGFISFLYELTRKADWGIFVEVLVTIRQPIKLWSEMHEFGYPVGWAEIAGPKKESRIARAIRGLGEHKDAAKGALRQIR